MERGNDDDFEYLEIVVSTWDDCNRNFDIRMGNPFKVTRIHNWTKVDWQRNTTTKESQESNKNAVR